MKVILLKDVAKTGRKYELKNVSDGYALNFLIPNKLARVATDKAVKELGSLIKKQEEKIKKQEEALIGNIRELKDSTVNLVVKINEEGHLFAKVDKKDIIGAIKDQKALEIDDNSIVLEKPIKEAGEHIIHIKANGDSATFKLNITSEE